MTAVEMLTHELDLAHTLPRTDTKSIVIATDGSETAIPAFNAARLLGEKLNVEVHVVSVIEPIPAILPSIEGMMLTPELDQSREQAQKTIVTDQIRAFDPGSQWTFDIRRGRAADTIVEFAREQQADLIIVGLNRHNIFGRIFGEETAMEIVRLSTIPLLVASPDMKRLPERINVSMDLNPDGLAHAAEILEVLAGGHTVSCVHVKPRSEMIGIDWAALDGEYELAMRDRFETLRKTLEAVNLRSHLIVLHGDVAHELTDFAEYSKAELLVVGVRKRGNRPVGGRLASRLIRHAECSVLVV